MPDAGAALHLAPDCVDGVHARFDPLQERGVAAAGGRLEAGEQVAEGAVDLRLM